MTKPTLKSKIILETLSNLPHKSVRTLRKSVRLVGGRAYLGHIKADLMLVGL